MSAFEHVITSLDELRSLIEAPPPGARSLLKDRPSLDPHTRAFIAHSPFLLLGTSGVDGRCDVSPRGDAPGFVQVLDDQRLVIPERPGNKRLDSLQNQPWNQLARYNAIASGAGSLGNITTQHQSSSFGDVLGGLLGILGAFK